jgi:hypothetical protein
MNKKISDRDTLIEELGRAVKGLNWIFAKTMPQFPYRYIVRSPENEDTYVRLFNAIRAHGYDQKFRGRRQRYLELGDGYKYWAMTTRLPSSRIINRDKDVRETP